MWGVSGVGGGQGQGYGLDELGTGALVGGEGTGWVEDGLSG